MKKNNVKKISVIALSAISLALVGGGAAAFTPTNVSATTDVVTSVEAYGAPLIRVLSAKEGNYTGIRFGAKINNYKEDYSYGMIVAPTALFDYYETIINEQFNGDIKAAAAAGGIELVDLACLPQYGDFDKDGAEEWYIQGSLVDIKPANMNTDFVGVGYYNDGVKTVYDTTWEDNATSVGYVASEMIHEFESGNALYNACLNFANGAVAVVDDSATFAITATESLSLFVNGTANMGVTQSPAMNFYVKYFSDNEDVATVSADGTITAVSAGTTTITAYCVDKTVECEVTVGYDWANIDYDFDDGENDVDLTTIKANYGTAELNGIVTDGTVSAVKITKDGQGGAHINFNDIDVTKYSAITLTARKSDGMQNLFVNVTGGKDADGQELSASIYAGAITTTSYSNISLKVNGLTVLNEIRISNDNGSCSGAFYIDSITFVEKITDPSFGTKLDDTYTYISDFNDDVVLQMTENFSINAWGSASNAVATISRGACMNGNGLCMFASSTGNAYGMKFTMSDAFDLTKVEKLVVDFNYSGWHNGNLYNFIYVCIGSTRLNVGAYATVIYGDNLQGDDITSSANQGSYFKYNLMYGQIVIDVQEMLKDAAFSTGKTIDGFIFGANLNSDFTYCVDAVYYSTLAE